MKWCLKCTLFSGSVYLILLSSFSPTAIAAPDLNESIFLAQRSSPNPNRDRLLPSDSVPLEPTEPDEGSEPATPPLPPSNLENLDLNQSIEVNTIEVEASQVFAPEQLDAIVQNLEGKTVPLGDIIAAVNEITGLYVSEGYITSYAQLDRDSLLSGDGNLIIQLVEGEVTVEIEGTERLNVGYVRSRIELGAGKPLNVNELEDQLRLLKVNPLIENIEATLRPQEPRELGQSILAITVIEADPFFGNAYIDNYSPPAVGSERFGARLGYGNLTGLGDTLSAEYYRTTIGGSETGNLLYRVPINAKNGTVQFRVLLNDNEITEEPFDEFDFRGNSELYELSYRQPIVRTFEEEFALAVGFAFREGQTFTFAGPTPFSIGPEDDGRSRTSVIKIGQDYTLRQRSGAWAIRSQFNIGVDVFDATINHDSIPDSQFFSWLLQLQRVEILNSNNFLIVQLDLQLTPDSLLPSEQFIIGGGQSVRGFRQNVRAGDNGFRLSVEDRITVQRDEAGNPTLQVSPFIDMGSVWNSDNNPNELPDQRFIIGIGGGVLWQPISNLQVRIDYGLPLVNLDDRGDNIQDDGLYFSTNYAF